MLKQRILTALVLIPVALAAILWADPRGFGLLIAIAVVIGATEWGRMARLSETAQGIYALLTVCLIFFIYASGQIFYYQLAIFLAVIFWIAAVIVLLAYQKQRKLLPHTLISRLILGQLLLVTTWSSLFYIKSYLADGSLLLLLLMLVIWGADSAAYFIGKKWGKRRLASRVSPGKTWEGTLAGLFAGIIIGLVYVVVFYQEMNHYFAIMLTLFATVVFSVVGDLFESIIKRDANVKDSGQFLPGHGGILDRIDSLTAAGPVFAFAFILMGQAL